MAVELSIQVNLRPLRRLRRDLGQLGRRGPFVDLMDKWVARYLGFARRRYVRFSRGGGDWPPLAPATVRKRRRGTTSRMRCLQGWLFA